FSSRRRHTRWPRDWSSDVCSSDLARKWLSGARADALHGRERVEARWRLHLCSPSLHPGIAQKATYERETSNGGQAKLLGADLLRSEERRVGKECRSRRSP